MTSRPIPVTVVGGGLAGMAAALRLLERGCRVSLYESSDRLGGKAGANQNGPHFDEHGYKIFPLWYLNLEANPGVTVQIGDEIFDCRARSANADEKAEIWPRLVDYYSGYQDYQDIAERDIPVVFLSPNGGAQDG